MPKTLAAAWSQLVVPSAPKGNSASRRTAPRSSSAPCGFAEERLGEKKARIWSDGWEVGGAACGEAVDRTNAEFVEQAEELILDDIGQRADDHQALFARHVDGQFRDQRREAGVLALSEGCCSMPLPEIVEGRGRRHAWRSGAAKRG